MNPWPVDPNAPARVDVLDKVVVAPAFTFGVPNNLSSQTVATIGPDAGQYWYPTMIVVSSVAGSGNTAATASGKPFCTVYVGGPGVYDLTSYLDDTQIGVNDTTTICSGMMVQPGQKISAIWQMLGSPPPNQTTVMHIYGYVSNVPLSANVFLPGIPGARFAGHLEPNGEQIFPIPLPGAMNAGTSYDSGFIDISKFESYTINVDASTIPVPTNSNSIAVTILQYDIPGSTILRADFAEFYANQAGAVGTGFPQTQNGQLVVRDQCHGNWLRVILHNSGVDQIGVSLTIAGQSRPVGGLYIREFSDLITTNFRSPDNLILDALQTAVPAGRQDVWTTQVGCGPCMFIMIDQTQTFTMDVLIAGAQVISDRFTLVAGSTTRTVYYLPNRGARILVTNTGAAGGVYGLKVVRIVPPY